VAGASEGLGAAYAQALAARGLSLALVARRAEGLRSLASRLDEERGAAVRLLPGDLGDPGFVAALGRECADLEVGTLVYNAAFAPRGEFAVMPVEQLDRVVQVNVRAPLTLVRTFLPAMMERGRGAVVLMSSLAGNQGSPYLAAYAASKAFNRELAESLWYEARSRGVDVVACCAGAVRTPGYLATSPEDAPGTLDPAQVAETTLKALGKGPVVIPGAVNRVADFLMTRVLPRRFAIAMMATSTAALAPSLVSETDPSDMEEEQ
jgi:short-subunit dehydrogenase